MGNSAKIRHRRRRREQLRHARSEFVAGKLADLVLAPLRERRRLPLGFVEVAPVGGARQVVPAADALDDALARALRDLDPDSASGLKPDT